MGPLYNEVLFIFFIKIVTQLKQSQTLRVILFVILLKLTKITGISYLQPSEEKNYYTPEFVVWVYVSERYGGLRGMDVLERGTVLPKLVL